MSPNNSEDPKMKDSTIGEDQNLALCIGCREDFYNDKNPLGVKRCWSLKSAEPAKGKFVHISSVLPWNTQRVEDTLNCHRRGQHIAVLPEQTA